jgi:AcrR family transcriptional regulator
MRLAFNIFDTVSIFIDVTSTTDDARAIVGCVTTEMTADPVRRRAGRSKGDRREEQILAATRELAARKSMAAITIDDIAAAAGISRTSFYFYFSSKQAVLARLMEQVDDRFLQTHLWHAADGPSPAILRAQLAAAARLWREVGPIMDCTLHGGYGESYPPLEEFVARIQHRFITGLAVKLERDQAAGLGPAGIDPLTLARLIALMRDGRLTQLAAASEADVERGLDELAEAILRLVYGTYTSPATGQQPADSPPSAS